MNNGNPPSFYPVDLRAELKIELLDTVEELRAEAQYLWSLANDLSEGILRFSSLEKTR